GRTPHRGARPLSCLSAPEVVPPTAGGALAAPPHAGAGQPTLGGVTDDRPSRGDRAGGEGRQEAVLLTAGQHAVQGCASTERRLELPGQVRDGLLVEVDPHPAGRGDPTTVPDQPV